MMRCEVCGYKIPRGEKVCSHCGYQLKKTIVIDKTSYDDLNDNILKSNKISVKDKIKLKYAKSWSEFKSDKVKMILLLFVIVTLVGYIDPFKTFNEMSFRDVVKRKRDDDYKTVEKAIQYENELVDNFNELGVSYVNSEEEVNNYEDGLEAKCSILGKYNSIEYTISYTIRCGEKDEFYIMTGTTVDDVNEEFPLKDLDVFSEIMGYESLVSVIEDTREYNSNGYLYEGDSVVAFERVVAEGYDLYYQVAGNGYIIKD